MIEYRGFSIKAVAQPTETGKFRSGAEVNFPLKSEGWNAFHAVVSDRDYDTEEEALRAIEQLAKQDVDSFIPGVKIAFGAFVNNDGEHPWRGHVAISVFHGNGIADRITWCESPFMTFEEACADARRVAKIYANTIGLPFSAGKYLG